MSNSTDEARIGRYAPGDGFWFHVRSLARKMVLRNIKSVNIKPHQETMLTLHSSKRINKTEKAPCCPVQRHVTNAMTEILPFSAAYDDRKWNGCSRLIVGDNHYFIRPHIDRPCIPTQATSKTARQERQCCSVTGQPTSAMMTQLVKPTGEDQRIVKRGSKSGLIWFNCRFIKKIWF